MTAIDRMALRRVTDRAVTFLVSRQAETGIWQDFDLEPGSSDAWVTAYVGQALQSVGGSEADQARGRAADWLQQAHRPSGGWGYNALTPVDADTTAHALLFLLGQQSAVPAAAVGRLRHFANPDGSFRTFDGHDSEHSWGHGHPEVTAAAARTLYLFGEAADVALVDAATAYLRATQQSNGLWQAFWWTTPLYSAVEAIQLLDTCGGGYDREDLRRALAAPAAGAFEEALQVRLLVSQGFRQRADIVMGRLLASQQLDGSWRSIPILRVTAPDSSLDVPAGPIAADSERLFTTATVVLALAAYSRGDM